MRKIATLVTVTLLSCVSLLAHAQTGNTFFPIQFQGADVGTKIANAQNACNSNTSIPCIIIIDPVLNAYPTGTLPAKCSQCIWFDYRSQMGIANMTFEGNWSSLSNYSPGDVVLYNGIAYLDYVAASSQVPTPTFIQSGFTAFTASSAPGTIAFPGSVTTGDLLLVFAGSNGTTNLTVTDSLGTVYTKAVGQTGQTNNSGWWYGIAPAAGADSVTISGWGSWPGAQVQEWRGITNSLAGTPTTAEGPGGAGDGTGLLNGSMTTTNAALVLWGVLSNHQASPFSITGTGDNFSLVSSGTHEATWILSQTDSIAGTVTGSVNLSAYNNDYASGAMVAFAEGVNPPPVDVGHWVQLSSLAYNFNSTQPAAQANFLNATIQTQGANITAEIPYATAAAFGVLECGANVTCTNGVISVAAPPGLGSSSAAGLIQCGSGTNCAGGVLSVTAASTATIHTAKVTGGCTTGSSSYSQCGTPNTLTWSGGGFGGSAPTVVECTGVNGSDARIGPPQVVSYSATQIVVQTVTEGSVAVSWGEIGCVGIIPVTGQ